jgi:hypothetical protein
MDSAATDVGNSPVQLCQQVVSVLCRRSNECNSADASATDEATCNTLENIDFGCDRAVSAGFAVCLSDVKALSCASLFTAMGLAPPSSCNEPFNSTPLSDAQMKCLALADAICHNAAMCAGVSAPTAMQLSQCQQDVSTQIQCAFAVDVSATYGQCLTDVANAPCASADGGAADGGTMSVSPACHGVIKGPM